MYFLPAHSKTSVRTQRPLEQRWISAQVIAVVMATIVGPAADAETASESLERGLVARWTFDEADGHQLTDTTGGGSHGTLQGGATRVAGPQQKAVAFDGQQGRIWIDTPRALDLPSELSVFAWVRCENVTAGVHGQCIYGQTAPGGNGGQYELCVGRGENLQEVTVLWRNVEVCVSDSKLETGRWYHLGFTRSGRPGNWNCTIYVDGKVSGMADDITTDAGPALPFAIGRPGAYDGLYFQGSVDDFRIYNRPLIPSEVKALSQVR